MVEDLIFLLVFSYIVLCTDATGRIYLPVIQEWSLIKVGTDCVQEQANYDVFCFDIVVHFLKDRQSTCVVAGNVDQMRDLE